MAEEEKVKVVIAFDPENPERQDKTESLPASEAYNLVQTGRARLAEESSGKKSDGGKAATLS